MNAIGALERIAAQLGITAEELAAAEHATVLSLSARVPAATARTLTRQQVDDFTAAFGSSGSLVVRHGDLAEFAVRNGVEKPGLDHLHGGTNTPAAGFEVALRIDKAQLAEQLVQEPADAQVHTFVYPAAFEHVLAGGPVEIGRQLWPQPDKRLVVLILAADVHLIGDSISVVGGSHLDAAAAECAREPAAGLDRIARLRAPYIGWDNSIETQLTPGHFRHTATASAPFAGRLDALAVGLGAMYLCDRARLVDSGDTAAFVQTEFRGREHVAFVPVAWSSPPTDLDPADVSDMHAIVDWCYRAAPEHPDSEPRRHRDMVGDRLPFVQTRIAQLVENRRDTGGLAGFTRVMPVVHGGLDSLWQSYVEGRVNEYLDHVRDLDSIVDTAVERLSDQTSTLTKRLAETALAAVAALIGSFIGAAFKSPFNADVFRIGMYSYAAYVVVFPLIIGVLAARSDVNVALRSFYAKRNNLARVLGENRVEDLVGERDTKAANRFRIWMAVVVVVHLGAAGAAALAAKEVPDLVNDTATSGATTTVPTAPPDTSPTTAP